LEILELITRLYYEEFYRCDSCQKAYWAGSHFENLRDRWRPGPTDYGQHEQNNRPRLASTRIVHRSG
jgi:hypothetical protein